MMRGARLGTDAALAAVLFVAAVAPDPARAEPKPKDDSTDMVIDELAAGVITDPKAASPPSAKKTAAPQSAPAPVADGPRRVIVAPFDSPQKSWGRPSVLGVLSEEPDVEVVGYEDMVVVAKRLGANPTEPRGRQAVSAEMGIFAWIDGTVGDDGNARLVMTDANGAELAWLTAAARSGGALNAFIEENVWHAFGPYLSDAEKRRQRLEALKVLGKQKQEARASEAHRQVVLVEEREARIASRLVAQKKVGAAKAQAREKESERQRKIVADRIAEAERKEREAAAEQQRLIAEQRRQLMMQQQAAQPTYAPQPQPAYGAAAPAYGDGYGAQPAPAPTMLPSQPMPASATATPIAEPPPPGPDYGKSAEFQEWVRRRQAEMGQPPPPQPQPPPPPAPPPEAPPQPPPEQPPQPPVQP